MTTALKPNAAPIPGYEVTERLGVGGYGEVWKAQAPGGLQKAIKFIYGYMNDEKATRELKALNRIKQIRHPFLLSLERIEIVDGQLLIVTELADGSLKDRFVACQTAGLAAVPRGELLEHLRDAADALDFLSENALQHLDVKPENLLMVGGRMKVADFGLVKDICDRTCSMMGGMTPVYAAPELFDGRPTAASDQYSLAIVYQEMLTATLPFPGTTAAQLASQHLHSRPQLESLPTCDIPIVARALAKNPADRFPTSRALIDALMSAERSASSAEISPAQDITPYVVRAHGVTPSRRALSRTPSPSRPTPPPRPSDSVTKTAPPAGKAPVIDLPPIDVQPDEVGLRPTLFLGIGGTAGFVLRRLRRRLSDRFGDLTKIPIFQMLLVDTDSRALASQRDSDFREVLGDGETLPLPLRKAQEYRADSLEILQWLSRRWLYNIPRSLQTEGLRPLGRLALVDHANELFDRLRQLLTAITSSESIAAAQQLTGLKLREATPRVFVIASISGGTGSGMVLDVAYAVRMLLADMGISDDGLCGVLAHSTQRNSTAKDLAVANAYACLSELYHYNREHYPGEPACGLPAFDRQGTFPRAYFVHLGDRLSEEEFARGTDALAEYLYLDAATAGGAFFDKCRASDADVGSKGEFQLRTLGICQLGCAHGDLPNAAADSLCRQLIDRWASGSRAPHATTAKSPNQVAGPDDPPGLDAAALTNLTRSEFDRALLPAKRAQLCQSLADGYQPTKNETPEQMTSALAERLRHSLGLTPESDRRPGLLVCLNSAADAIVGHHLQQLSTKLSGRVLAMADGLSNGLNDALAANERILERLRKTESELAGLGREIQDRISSAITGAHNPPTARRARRRNDESGDALDVLHALVSLFVEQKSLECASRLASSMVHLLTTTGESLVRARRETLEISSSFDDRLWRGRSSMNVGNAQNEIEQAVFQELDRRMPRLAAEFEKRVQEEVVAPRGGLYALLSASSEEQRLLPPLLRSLARRAVMDGLKELDIANMVLKRETDANHEKVQHCVESARPTVLDCGGAKRLLLVMPESSAAGRLPEIISQQHSERPTVLVDSDCDVVACYEAEGVGLSSVAAVIANQDPQCADVARRLHTRVDVEWSTI